MIVGGKKLNSKIYIGVATHKEYRMPVDKCYKPIHVGSINKETISNYQKDSEGDNISISNPNFCELTATYYIWKNISAEYKGLVHYRRHFTSDMNFIEFKTGEFSKIASEEFLLEQLKNTDIIVPKKRKYYIETLYSHYKHTHQISDLDETRKVIEYLTPEYLTSFDKVMKRKQAHMFNMYIMKSNLFDAYADWMFATLFELQQRVDITEYDVSEGRIFGYISELLLDVWIDKNQLDYIELPVMFMEKQNWFTKGSKFILNKFK